MQEMDRKEFILKSCRWVAGAGALYLAGNLISCSNAENNDTSASSDPSTSEKAGDSTTSDGGTSNGDSSTDYQSGGSASVAVVVSGRCIGCGKCARGICPNDAIAIVGDLAVIGTACDGCGRCVSLCPRDAIQLSSGLSSSRDFTFTAASSAPVKPAAA